MDYKKTIFQDLIIEPLSDINEVVYNVERSKQTKNEKFDSHNFNFHKHNGYYKNSNKIDKQKREIYYNKDGNEINNFFNIDKHFSRNYEESKQNIHFKADKIVNNKGLIKPKDDYYKIDEMTKFVNKMASLLKMADSNATALRTGFNNSSVSRRFNLDNTFVSIMTNILNKYVSSSFKFTQEMTEV